MKYPYAGMKAIGKRPLETTIIYYNLAEKKQLHVYVYIHIIVVSSNPIRGLLSVNDKERAQNIGYFRCLLINKYIQTKRKSLYY
jgi:hypothetical protein